MRDTLVVAVSQSGTTTDTNRTVDLVRGRGASVVAIVNRRGSDLCDKADGVLFTSDGRDVEMSVASTKAFYSQVAAGCLLGLALAEALRGSPPPGSAELLAALRALPEQMRAVLAQSDRIAELARRFAPPRRHWAVVGNGLNRIAAEEVRIKLSELCYKSIACDATEDKKHIDLSCEPLILVCAAGLTGSTASDVGKEVAIYRAHKAAPLVIATEGDRRYDAALGTIPVPATHPSLGFVLAAVAGHLFGYHSALAIDSLGSPLRQLRGVIEDFLGEGVPEDGNDLLARLAPLLAPGTREFHALLVQGRYDGALEASTAVRLSSLLRFATLSVPLEMFELEHGVPGTPGAVIERLTAALTRGIEELTRPIDAIKHQAKTVTVGVSRSDEALFDAPLVREVLAAGAVRKGLGYRDLRALAALSPAVDAVLGFTRYRIDGEDLDHSTVAITGRGGISLQLSSRTTSNPALRGTKHMVALERHLLVASGRADGRTVLLVPELQGPRPVGLTLLHVRFHDRLPPDVMRGVLSGYRNRYAAIRDGVLETEPAFREELLGQLPVGELLTASVQALADKWRR
jgi:glucosamine--fructose-6-phosphate aminotransferase (isomerizing)